MRVCVCSIRTGECVVLTVDGLKDLWLNRCVIKRLRYQYATGEQQLDNCFLKAQGWTLTNTHTHTQLSENHDYGHSVWNTPGVWYVLVLSNYSITVCVSGGKSALTFPLGLLGKRTLSLLKKISLIQHKEYLLMQNYHLEVKTL